VSFSIKAEGVVRGHWDRLRVDQILTNLITNAFKYGPGKPIEITLSEDGTDAVVAIQDGGVGIPKSDQDRIFARFERAAARGTLGLGLGLYIVREIVQAHGGTIAVESEPGKGSLFTLRLPLASRPDLLQSGRGGSVRSCSRESLRKFLDLGSLLGREFTFEHRWIFLGLLKKLHHAHWISARFLRQSPIKSEARA